MNRRTLRFAKRFGLPAFLVGSLLVLAQVVFAAAPTPGFDVTAPATDCGVYTFTSTATDGDDDIASIDWTFGDGGTGNGTPVQHTFTPGNYTVTQTVTDTDAVDGTVDSPFTSQLVNVTNTNPPTASVSATPNPAQPNTTVTLHGETSTDPGGQIVRYDWDLDGNGSYETPTGATPTATTTFAAGNHNVRLRVTDSCGATDVDAVGVSVQNTPPTASWTFSPTPGEPGEAMDFDASASADSGGGSIATYTWSWGDGTANTVTADPLTQHTFATAGQKLVTLTVTDNGGAPSGGNTQLVRVNAKPSADFATSPSAIGKPITFQAVNGNDDTGIASYQWDFESDGTFDATGPSATHTYSAANNYPVTLRITDNDGDFTDVTKNQVVSVTQPSPGFSFSPANPVPGQTVTLSSNSAPSSAAGHAITDTQWDFNFSPLSAFAVAKHGTSVTTSFATPGAHTVGLQVLETGGGSAIAYRTIVVNAPPRAAFTVRPAKPKQGQEITFLSTSSDAEGPIAKLAWDLDNDGKYDDGGGAVASTKKLKKGKHQVHLRVTDSKGASSVATVTVSVAAPDPKAPPDTTKTLGFAPRSWGIKVVALYVRVPSRTTVRLLCSGRGCPHGKFLKHSGKKRAVLRFSGFHGSLHAGSKITVISSRKGSIAEYFTYKVRSGYKEPTKLKRCKAPGSKKYRSCS